MKKLLSVLFVPCICIGMLSGISFAADVVASGTCGENLTWELDGEGVLTISGSGAMDDYDFDATAPWESLSDSIRKVMIGDSVTSVGDCAFLWCFELTNITIPNSVTSIGSSAFKDCDSLVTVVIPDSVTSIGHHAFSSCDSLVTVVIPDSVTSIGEYAFFGCESLTSVAIPHSVTTIGKGAFSSCEALTNIIIPDSVTTIGGNAFTHCSALTSIMVDANNPNFSSLDGNLYNKDQTVFIRYASGKRDFAFVIPDSVTMIDAFAFSFCGALTNITIPDSVTMIDNFAFSYCTALTSITIPDSVTSIGEGAFCGCFAMTDATIPDSVTVISDAAFLECRALTSITIPDSVTTIGDEAFLWCFELTNITIPDSVTSIGDSAFYECTQLADVYYGGNEADRNKISIASYGNDALTNATWHYNYVPESEVSLTTADGAQIRLNGNQGLRFISTIDKASVDSGKVVEYGTVLIPSADVTDISELQIGATLNGHAVAKVEAKNLYEVTENTITFTAVITDIKEKNYNRAYTARAYAILDDCSVVYADTGASRDVYTIAGKVLANETLSEKETAYLNRVIRYVEGIDVAVNFTEPVEDAQVPLSITVEGFDASIVWTKTGGSTHTGVFESGTDYTATIVLTAEEAFSPNDRATINGESAAFTLSEDGKTMTMQKTYEFKDAGYSGIY